MRTRFRRPQFLFIFSIAILATACGEYEGEVDEVSTSSDALALAQVEHELGAKCVASSPRELDQCIDADRSDEDCRRGVRITRAACEHGRVIERAARISLEDDAAVRIRAQRADAENDAARRPDARPVRPERACPDLANYCRAACAGVELPEIPEGCPIPGCACVDDEEDDARRPEPAPVRPEPVRPEPEGRPECPDLSNYCRAACAGAELPEIPEGCPIPSCLCPPEDEGDRCRIGCARRGHALLDQCIERAEEIDVDGARCGALARRAVHACVEENCVEDEEPPTCDERCGRRAQSVLRSCIARGGDEARCGAFARRAAAQCAERCGGDEGEGEGGGVEGDVECAQIAHRVLRQCAARGGDRARCGRLARAAQARCEAVNEGEGEEENACEATCAEHARGVADACVGSEDRCHIAVRTALRQCLQRCGGADNVRPDAGNERPEQPARNADANGRGEAGAARVPADAQR